MAALEVGQIEDREDDEDGNSQRKTPSGMEGVYHRGSSQRWQKRLYKADTLPLHIPAYLCGKSGRYTSSGAAVRKG